MSENEHAHWEDDDGDDVRTLSDTIRALPLWWHITTWTMVGVLVGGLLLGPMLAAGMHHA